MTKVLIVDDELLVRVGLSRSVDWSAFACEVVGEASSGREALALIREKKPDLVFLDITMPDMDGLQLMEQLRTLQLTPTIVVLSCHDEFEYVRAAMKLGAADYLLKVTIRKNDIEALLRKVLVGKESEETNAKALPPSGEEGAFFVMAVRNIDAPHAFDGKMELLQSAAKRIQETLASVRCCAADDILYVRFGFRKDAEQKEQAPEALARMFRNTCELLINGRMLCGVSAVCPGGVPEETAREQARNAMQYGFYNSRAICCYTQSQERLVPLKNTDVQRMETAVLSGNADQIAGFFDGLTRFAKVPPGRLKAYLLSQLVILAQRGVDMEGLRERVTAADTLEDMKAVFIQLSQELAQRKGAENPYVLQAQALVRQYYRNAGFSLRDIADALHLNASYVSRLFRTETGMTISEYLNAARVEAATQLLATGERSITETAEATGFRNIAYFTKVFKQMTGSNPSKIRQESKKSIKRQDRPLTNDKMM